jgi:hypothetical protein
VISYVGNSLPTFEACFQNWLDSQTDDELREACKVGSDLLEDRCGKELARRGERIQMEALPVRGDRSR